MCVCLLSVVARSKLSGHERLSIDVDCSIVWTVKRAEVCPLVAAAVERAVRVWDRRGGRVCVCLLSVIAHSKSSGRENLSTDVDCSIVWTVKRAE